MLFPPPQSRHAACTHHLPVPAGLSTAVTAVVAVAAIVFIILSTLAVTYACYRIHKLRKRHKLSAMGKVLRNSTSLAKDYINSLRPVHSAPNLLVDLET